jgi:hypothetical protein
MGSVAHGGWERSHEINATSEWDQTSGQAHHAVWSSHQAQVPFSKASQDLINIGQSDPETPAFHQDAVYETVQSVLTVVTPAHPFGCRTWRRAGRTRASDIAELLQQISQGYDCDG